MNAYSPQRGLMRAAGSLWIPAVTVVAAWMIFFLLAAGLGRYLGGAALAAIPALIVWKRPYWGLLALVTVGIAHSFLMMLFLHMVGSTTLLRMAQLWKELLLAVLLARAAVHVFRTHQLPKLHWIDLGIVAFLAIGALYLIYPGSVPDMSLFAKAMGLRADAFFLVAYVVGRTIPLTRDQARNLLVALGAMTVIVGAVAIAQFAAPQLTNRLFNQLGFQEFMLVQRGDLAVQESVRSRAISGIDLPRASSILLSDLVLSFFSLMTAPLALALFFTLERGRDRAMAYAFLAVATSLTFLTVTRSAIVALLPALALVAILSRRYGLLTFLAVQVVLAALLVAALTGVTPRTLQRVFSPDEGSVRAHIVAIQDSLDIVREEPLGRGLGTAGQVAQRLKPQGAITNESWYLQIATEIGIVPAVLYASILLGFGLAALRQYGRLSDPVLRGLTLGMGGGTLALGLVGLTLHAWEGLTISIIFWLLAGIVVRVEDLDPAR